MKLLGSLIAIAVGVFASLAMLVLLVAGMPNSSPQQLAEIRAYMWATGAAGLGGVALGVWGMTRGRHGFAVRAGLAPLGFVILLFIALLVPER